jgi:hypothetical protein
LGGRQGLGAFFNESRELRNEIEKAQLVIEKRAAKIATVTEGRLEKAREEILTETKRYLRLPRRLDIAPKEILESDIKHPEIVLEGPGVAPLVGALRSIQERRRALDVASSNFERKRESASEQFWFEGLSLEDMKREFPGSTSGLDQAAGDLALTLAVGCREFPILHRVWKTPDLSTDIEAVRSIRGEGALSYKSGTSGPAISHLKNSILDSLRNAWKANKDLIDNLKSDSALVWRFPPLIKEALDDLQFDDPSLEFQSAQERMAQEEGMSVASTLALVTGLMEMGAPLLAGPAAPEAMAVLAAASVVLSGTDLILEYIKLRTDERAFRAVLDPSLALASEPGYSGFVIGLACSLLDIKGFRDALRSVRYVGELDTAQKSLDILKS